MERYAAFLRGMNLGNRRITNDELRARFEQLGLADAATFRASGNVVFTADGGSSAAELSSRIEEGLAEALGYEVPVLLRAGERLRAICAHEPFPADVVASSRGKLQVMLLPAAPRREQGAEALALAGDGDRLALEGSELYWLPSGGVSESALDLRRLDALLGPTTTRTKGTLEAIAAKHL